MSEQRWLRAGIQGKPEAVDKQAKVIKGAVAAQLGRFKTQGRGEFDLRSLKKIVELGNANEAGLKARLGHATLSDDGVGRYLGRFRDFRMSSTHSEVLKKTVPAVRADLHFSETASKTPSGNLMDYVFDLSQEDGGALSTSLVLHTDEEKRLDAKGRQLVDDAGEPLPPIWLPTELHGLDVVAVGDAVDNMLSVDGDLAKLLRFDRVPHLAAQVCDLQFANMAREEVQAKISAWMQRYLDERFGPVEIISTPKLDKFRPRLDAILKRS